MSVMRDSRRVRRVRWVRWVGAPRRTVERSSFTATSRRGLT
ncbi:hypothetical protein HMPREF0321_2523 [Dermacoccus sp. Ellin185]|nr:hypothetical protein HMPREF0321_2523 [Dermacoccus sp. Ellin185]